jgi:CheY-like chemotaxis protein
VDKKRILIVDDEAAAARLLKANLEQTGCYEARVETWPEQAVPAAREFKPHLVLLDILMPEMLGGDVVAAFEADPVLKDMPIVFLTAAVRPEQIKAHEGIICEHPCLAKPASVEDIVRCIESTLSNKAQEVPFRMNMLPREVDTDN